MEGIHLVKEGSTATVCGYKIDGNWIRLTAAGHYQLCDCETCQHYTKLKPEKPKRLKKVEQNRLF